VWTAAFGLPVVPEVKASKAMSLAAVGQGAAVSACRAARASSESGGASEVLNTTKGRTAQSASACQAVCSSSCSFASHSAALGRALVMMADSSRARSSGMVATAISPACTTPSQASAIAMELPPRSSTRLPGSRPSSPVSTLAMRFTSVRAWA
jgi:hypothetical protein